MFEQWSWLILNPAWLMILFGVGVADFFRNREWTQGKPGPNGGGTIAILGTVVGSAFALVTGVAAALFTGWDNGWMQAIIAFFGFFLLHAVVNFAVIWSK